jgi:hypothetical protein
MFAAPLDRAHQIRRERDGPLQQSDDGPAVIDFAQLLGKLFDARRNARFIQQNAQSRVSHS